MSDAMRRRDHRGSAWHDGDSRLRGGDDAGWVGPDGDSRLRGGDDADGPRRRQEQLPPPVVRDGSRRSAHLEDAPPDDAGQHDRDGHGPLDAPDADGDARRPRHHEIEEAVPASVRLRMAFERASSRVRGSVPLRTGLFVLPPLLLPLALGLSLATSLVVTLLLLWLAAAAGLLATIMFDGSDQLALRAIDRRLQAFEASGGVSAAASAEPAAGRGVAPARQVADTEDALLAIGSQLDRLNDRLDDLALPRGRAHRPDDHRPDEQWSGQLRPGQDVEDAPDWGVRQWGERGRKGRAR